MKARPAPPPAAGAPADALLDEAHRGDIEGAFGTIHLGDDDARRTWKARLLTLLAVMGPGLIVMIGDNDAGGVATYAQAGQNYGTSLLWVLLLLIPVLIVNQEMVVRLGLVTGVGHARLINERFGRFWGFFSVGDLFLLNFLTIVTEFIGVGLALAYFGVSQYLAVPLAALGLVAVAVTGSFRRWERAMYALIAINMAIFPLAFMAHPSAGPILHDFVVPHIQGGLTATSLLLIIAIVGTTIAPWQLFFQQSSVIDKRLTPRWMAYEWADTAIGSVLVIVGAAALIVIPAFAFAHTHIAGAFVDAGATASALSHRIGRLAGALFAIVLLDSSLLGASAVTLATSYAVGDVFGLHHSLHRPWREAKAFYALYAGMVVVAAGIVLIPHAPLGLITTAVQALAGILLPSATVFLLLLCNDPAVLGPWVNGALVNALASVIVGVLVVLSLILATVTVFPDVDVVRVTVLLALVLVAALAAMGLLAFRRRGTRTAAAHGPIPDRATWRMPPLELLPKPVWSAARKGGMLALRGYLLVAVLLLVVKVVQLAGSR